VKPIRPDRRTILTGAGALGGALAMPALSYGQVDAVRIGHLTPLNGSLGALGEYAQLGIRLAADEINADGGILGRKVDLMMEDSSKPEGAAAQAERLITRDKVVVLIGEVSSASALAIGQVAGRLGTVFLNTGARSDALRTRGCTPFLFHVSPSNTMMTRAVGEALTRQGLISGRKWALLTADDAAGRDLLEVSRAFLLANGGQIASAEMVPSDTTDFGPVIQSIRQARPATVCPNLSGRQMARFLKHYAEAGLSVPLAGFGFNLVAGWAAGAGNVSGTWPLAWFPRSESASAKSYVEAFTKAYGRAPDDQSWADFVSLKLVAQAFTELKSTEPSKLSDHLRRGTPFDILKGREGRFRASDNQLLQPLSAVRAREPAKMRDRWDIVETVASVPSAGEDLSVLAPEKDGACRMPG
jgi:branched-chain amino acid transport system substrate-binding protein